jgi:hypothetical protein
MFIRNNVYSEQSLYITFSCTCSILCSRTKAVCRKAKLFESSTQGPECHSERLDLLLSDSTERFGGGCTIRHLLGQMVKKCRRFWVESLQCRIVRVRVWQFPNGGLINDHSALILSSFPFLFTPPPPPPNRMLNVPCARDPHISLVLENNTIL